MMHGHTYIKGYRI